MIKLAASSLRATRLQLRLGTETPTSIGTYVMCLTVRLVLVAYLVDFGLGPDITFRALRPTWEAHVRTAAHLMEGVVRG